MLHNTFPPRSNSAPKPVTTTLMQENITMHEKFLRVYMTCHCHVEMARASTFAARPTQR